MSVYTTISTGPRRAADPDGPGEYHVVILDNGRSALLAGADIVGVLGSRPERSAEAARDWGLETAYDTMMAERASAPVGPR